MKILAFAIALASILFGSSASAVIGTERDWSIAVVGDMHFGTVGQATYTNRFIPYILTNSSPGTMNVKVFISPGDCFEQNTNFGAYVTSTVYAMRDGLWYLATNGVLVIPAQGNHDGDDPGGWAQERGNNGNGVNSDLAVWQDVYGTNIWNQTGSIGTRLTNDYSNWAVSFTNSDGTKFLFMTYKVMTSVTPDGNDAGVLAQFYDQNSWITNMALTHLDHNVILIAHYIINANGVISGKDATGYSGWNGPSVAVLDPRILALPNLFMTISGHDRRMFKVHKYIYGTDKHRIDVLGVNSQGHTNNPGFIYLITFRPGSPEVRHSTFDTYNNRFLNNADTNLNFYAEGAINPVTGLYYSYTNIWTNQIVVRPSFSRTTPAASAPSRVGRGRR